MYRMPLRRQMFSTGFHFASSPSADKYKRRPLCRYKVDTCCHFVVSPCLQDDTRSRRVHVYRRVQIELSHSYFLLIGPCSATSASLKGAKVGRSSLSVTSESSRGPDKQLPPSRDLTISFDDGLTRRSSEGTGVYCK